MHNTVKNLVYIEDLIKSKVNHEKIPQIIAVSKTFPIESVLPLINHGHLHYGENKVQEAIDKWVELKSKYTDIKLHLIGKLQTNKVKLSLKVFDYIHSLDNEKLAKKIADEQNKQNKKPKIFIQVNIGNEEQKSGIDKKSLKDFYEKCTKEFELNIIGLMCIPPQEGEIRSYFKNMAELNKSIGLKDLSMGMSSDYLDAIDYGATFIRIGSMIFGNRS